MVHAVPDMAGVGVGQALRFSGWGEVIESWGFRGDLELMEASKDGQSRKEEGKGILKYGQVHPRHVLGTAQTLPWWGAQVLSENN